MIHFLLWSEPQPSTSREAAMADERDADQGFKDKNYIDPNSEDSD